MMIQFTYEFCKPCVNIGVDMLAYSYFSTQNDNSWRNCNGHIIAKLSDVKTDDIPDLLFCWQVPNGLLFNAQPLTDSKNGDHSFQAVIMVWTSAKKILLL